MIHQRMRPPEPEMSERQAEALYHASCAVGDLLHLLDTMAMVMEQDVADAAALQQQMLGCTRIAREAVASTLSALLLAEGAGE